jgi:hypothetical protein
MKFNETVQRVASITGNPTIQLQEWFDGADADQQSEFETLSQTSPQAAWSALSSIHDAYAKKATVDIHSPTSTTSTARRKRRLEDGR